MRKIKKSALCTTQNAITEPKQNAASYKLLLHCHTSIMVNGAMLAFFNIYNLSLYQQKIITMNNQTIQKSSFYNHGLSPHDRLCKLFLYASNKEEIHFSR